ncbi:hypothetical protein DPEC_G00362820 [Dallia pectoralis]|nr:hypothetical protein DPEC_G00362820 [Dallia pectoralis]
MTHKEVEPLAHLYVVSWNPSLVQLPVSVYRSTPGTSWMHFTCFFWVVQMCSILARFSSGIPMRSLPSPHQFLQQLINEEDHRGVFSACPPPAELGQLSLSDGLVHQVIGDEGHILPFNCSLFTLRSSLILVWSPTKPGLQLCSPPPAEQQQQSTKSRTEGCTCLGVPLNKS